MLVLSRSSGQSIDVAGPCRITIVRIGGQKVRVGIEAHPSVSVLRSELKERDGDGDGDCIAGAGKSG